MAKLLMAKKSRWTMPTPTLVVAEEVEIAEVVEIAEEVDSADVVLDVEAAAEDMSAVKEADLVMENVEAAEDLEADVVVAVVAATTATKKVILPENAPRVPLDPIKDEASLIYHKKVETVVAMADPNTKNGTLTRNPANFSCLDVIKKIFQNLKIIIKTLYKHSSSSPSLPLRFICL